MLKLNRVRWLYISKITLFFVQLLYIGLIFTAFILIVSYPLIPINGLTYSLGGYQTNAIVDNLIIKDFIISDFQVSLIVFISVLYLMFLFLSFVNNRYFRFDNFKYKKIIYINVTFYTALLILSFTFMTAKPYINYLNIQDMVQLPTTSHLLNIFYLINIGDQNITFSITSEGTIIIVIFSILLSICVGVLLLVVKKVIQHKFF